MNRRSYERPEEVERRNGLRLMLVLLAVDAVLIGLGIWCFL